MGKVPNQRANGIHGNLAHSVGWSEGKKVRVGGETPSRSENCSSEAFSEGQNRIRIRPVEDQSVVQPTLGERSQKEVEHGLCPAHQTSVRKRPETSAQIWDSIAARSWVPSMTRKRSGRLLTSRRYPSRTFR